MLLNAYLLQIATLYLFHKHRCAQKIAAALIIQDYEK